MKCTCISELTDKPVYGQLYLSQNVYRCVKWQKTIFHKLLLLIKKLLKIKNEELEKPLSIYNNKSESVPLKVHWLSILLLKYVYYTFIHDHIYKLFYGITNDNRLLNAFKK